MKSCCKKIVLKELSKIAKNYAWNGKWHFGIRQKHHGDDIANRINRVIKEIRGNNDRRRA